MWFILVSPEKSGCNVTEVAESKRTFFSRELENAVVYFKGDYCIVIRHILVEVELNQRLVQASECHDLMRFDFTLNIHGRSPVVRVKGGSAGHMRTKRNNQIACLSALRRNPPPQGVEIYGGEPGRR